MGNVQIHFDRTIFLDSLGVSQADKDYLMREGFTAVEWVQMDRGSKTEETALEGICKRIPERLHAAAERLEFHNDVSLLRKDLRAAGVQVRE